VAEGEREKIFEAFHRFDPSRQRASGGAGLGLAITSAIVRAHGGQLGMVPREGGGSVFWVQLPAEVPDREAAGGAPEAEVKS
jgi:two-component system sensor histidine kinase BaeS